MPIAKFWKNTLCFYLPLIKALVDAKTRELVLLSVNILLKKRSIWKEEIIASGFQLPNAMETSSQNLLAAFKLLSSIKDLDPSKSSQIDKYLTGQFKCLCNSYRPGQEWAK